jgi:hypothetical protein
MSSQNITKIPLKVKIRTLLINIVYSPNIYVALVIGALVGGFFGSMIGMFSGAYIGSEYNVCADCPSVFLGRSLEGVDLNKLFGAVSGSMMGTFSLGNATCLATIFHTYNNRKLSKTLSHDNIHLLFKFCFLISLELSAGALIGAIILNLFFPGIGAMLGATIGFVIMFILTTFQVKYPLQTKGP